MTESDSADGDVGVISTASGWYGEPQTPSGGTLLLAIANPLLDMVVQMRASTTILPEQLRTYLVGEIRRFQERAARALIPQETIVAARYCLCTVLDETAALTTWGGNGVWSSHSLLVTFHNETWGGEKFFQLLARLTRNPTLHIDLIELFYYCLALGFEGRYRVLERGNAQLAEIKQRLRKLIRSGRGTYEHALSPRAAAGPRKDATGRFGWLPLWMWFVLASLIAMFVFVGLWMAIDERGDNTVEAIEAVQLPRTVFNVPTVAPKVADLLAALIKSGAIDVQDLEDRSIVTLHGDGLFDSGSVTVKASYLPVLASIAQVLNRFSGDIVINGYTDNQPVHTKAFPSNVALSQARADAVKQQLIEAGLAANRSIVTTGRGDADPLASNSTPQGRARNRRVDILLFPAGSGTTGFDNFDN